LMLDISRLSWRRYRVTTFSRTRWASLTCADRK
jgi:hypothetical protein